MCPWYPVVTHRPISNTIVHFTVSSANRHVKAFCPKFLIHRHQTITDTFRTTSRGVSTMLFTFLTAIRVIRPGIHRLSTELAAGHAPKGEGKINLIKTCESVTAVTAFTWNALWGFLSSLKMDYHHFSHVLTRIIITS
ncbi:uncharacterized protein LOC135168060 [Diachasmimorpha longicaudata]|uniref:uncharacterized protein LOC135168060 n=1 Tax=Diachasmimorpha longicaudata TaxID=58733 RepID=UPI0030B8E736